MSRPRTSSEIHFDLIMAAVYVGIGLGVFARYATAHYENVLRAERISKAIIGPISRAQAATARIRAAGCADPACPSCAPQHHHLDASEQQL